MKTKNFISPFISCVVQNFPFIEESFDGLTQYQLLCKIVEKLNEVITQTNSQSENITKLEDAFNTLKNYVDNYFNNLDVQTEINKKLDEMALSGELEEIIASYLNTQAVRGFSTLNDLKNATGLITGAICQTSGKNTYNDGFGSLYRIRSITNEDTIDNDKLVAITTDISLVAEKITNNISNSKTTGTDNTYSCDYINNQVDDINDNINNKPNAINAYTTSTKNTYACDYINANTIPVIEFSGDFNNYKETAIGQCQMSANKPPTDADYFYGTVIVIKFGSAYCSQLTTDINSGKMYNRVLINDSWSAWKEVQQNNI